MKFAEIEKNYKSLVIAIDEQGIRRLYSEILDKLSGDSGRGRKIKLALSYSDGSSFVTEDIEDLTNEENRAGREIKKITIEGSMEEKRIHLIFGTQYDSIQCRIVGPNRQWVYVTQSIIEDRIRTFKVRRVRNGWFVFVLFLILAIPCTYIYVRSEKYLPPVLATKGGIGVLILVAIYVFIGLILGVILGYLFPNITFLFGKEIQRNNRRLGIRSRLFWVVGVGLFLTILGSFLFAWLKKL